MNSECSNSYPDLNDVMQNNIMFLEKLKYNAMTHDHSLLILLTVNELDISK